MILPEILEWFIEVIFRISLPYPSTTLLLKICWDISYIATVAVITRRVVRPFQVIIVNVIVVVFLPEICKIIGIFGCLLYDLVVIADVRIFSRLLLLLLSWGIIICRRLCVVQLSEIFEIVRGPRRGDWKRFEGIVIVSGGWIVLVGFVRIFGLILIIIVIRWKCCVFVECLWWGGIFLIIYVGFFVVEPVV